MLLPGVWEDCVLPPVHSYNDLHDMASDSSAFQKGPSAPNILRHIHVEGYLPFCCFAVRVHGGLPGTGLALLVLELRLTTFDHLPVHFSSCALPLLAWPMQR